MTNIHPATPENIALAAERLRKGELVAFPTETVYGLGADATNDHAVARIYAAKGRPSFNPLIIHASCAAELDTVVIWTELAQELAAQFWPGPLTLVLPRHALCPVSLLASAGLNSIAVRVPATDVARALIKLTGKPIAAPSANISGHLSPTTPFHVAQSLGDKAGFILADGKTSIGLESTVLDLTQPQPQILRHGGVTFEELQRFFGSSFQITAQTDLPARQEGGYKSPGQLTSHYAPDLTLRLEALTAEPDEAFLTFGPDNFAKGGAFRLNLSPKGDVTEAAANLFAMLRQLDQPRFSRIAVMPIPHSGLGAAINDRLTRAAAKRD